MIYTFECYAHGKFEVEQGMMEEHHAYCPVCKAPAQRIYLPLSHYWRGEGYTKSGERILNEDLPQVPSGTKWTHGWSPKEA